MSAIELQEVREKADFALRAVDADAGASPVLAAVVREFAAKSAKAMQRADVDHEWESVVEVEQAGDSAKAAAEADGGAAESTTSAVLAAHLTICMLKADLAKAAE